MSSNSGCPGSEIWLRLLEQSAEGPDELALMSHLEHCPACLATFNQQAGQEGIDLIQQDSVRVGPKTLSIGLQLAERTPPEGSEPEEEPLLTPPDIPGLAQFERISQGGMGIVFQARETALGRAVAVKLLSRPDSSRQRVRALREAQVLARFRHPNVVSLLSAGEIDGRPYLVMEWVPGGTLQNRIDHEKPTPRLAAKIVSELASAVSEAHALGIIHRDLKPANVLLAPRAQGDLPFTPKLADFGLARSDDAPPGLTEIDQVMGTPSYMAPEQTGLDPGFGQVGPATDLHGLGGILYALLTGRPPYESPTKAESLLLAARGQFPPLGREVPRDLRTIVEKSLAPAPQKRYRSATELADDLGRFLDGRPILARPVAWPERLTKWCKRRPAVAASTLLAMAAILGSTSGMAYHLHTVSRSLIELTAAQTQTAQALANAGQHREKLRNSLIAITDSALARLLERGLALNESDRDYLRKIRDQFLEWPLEPDPLTAYKYQAEGLTRIAQLFLDTDRYEDAKICAHEAISSLSGALQISPNDFNLIKAQLKALSYLRRCDFLMEQYSEAASTSKQMIRQLQSLTEHEPAYRPHLADAWVQLGDCLARLGQTEQALKGMQTGLDIAEQNRLGALDQIQAWTGQVWLVYNAALISRHFGRLDDWENGLRAMQSLAAKGAARFPSTQQPFTSAQRVAYECLTESLVSRGQSAAAATILPGYLAMCQRAQELWPDELWTSVALIDAGVSSAAIHNSLGKPEDAEPDVQAAIKLGRGLVIAEPAVFDRARTLTSVLAAGADLYRVIGRLPEAARLYQEMEDVSRPWLTLAGRTAEVRALIISALRHQVDCASKQEDHATAVKALERWLELDEPLSRPVLLVRLARERSLAGDTTRAHHAAVQAADYYESRFLAIQALAPMSFPDQNGLKEQAIAQKP